MHITIFQKEIEITSIEKRVQRQNIDKFINISQFILNDTASYFISLSFLNTVNAQPSFTQIKHTKH